MKHEYVWGGHCECGHASDSHGLPGPGGIVYGEQCYFGEKGKDRCSCLVYRKCYCLESVEKLQDILKTEKRSRRW